MRGEAHVLEAPAWVYTPYSPRRGQPKGVRGATGVTTAWFTADVHIGHRMVAGLRGFDDTGDHDAALAESWDSTVSKDDHVWLLGDISAGGAAGQRAALEWISRRPGVKHLIAGNHDGVHPMNRNAHKFHPAYAAVFDSVAAAGRRRIDGVEVLLSHFPFDGDHTEVQRYDQWRLRDLGIPVLHGHTHLEGRVSRSAADTQQIHVGVDAWELSLVSLAEVSGLLQEGANA